MKFDRLAVCADCDEAYEPPTGPLEDRSACPACGSAAAFAPGRILGRRPASQQVDVARLDRSLATLAAVVQALGHASATLARPPGAYDRTASEQIAAPRPVSSLHPGAQGGRKP